MAETVPANDVAGQGQPPLGCARSTARDQPLARLGMQAGVQTLCLGGCRLTWTEPVRDLDEHARKVRVAPTIQQLASQAEDSACPTRTTLKIHISASKKNQPEPITIGRHRRRRVADSEQPLPRAPRLIGNIRVSSDSDLWRGCDFLRSPAARSENSTLCCQSGNLQDAENESHQSGCAEHTARFVFGGRRCHGC